MRPLAILCLLLAGCALFPMRAIAKDNAELAQSLARLQARDRQLIDVGWRLTTGNAAFCADARPSVGLLLQDMAGYGRGADDIRTLLGLQGDIAVEAVATGSPAWRAGLQANDSVLILDDQDMTTLPAPDGPAWQRLTGLHDRIDASLADDGQLLLTSQRGNEKPAISQIEAVPACPSRFEVLDSGRKALAEGSRVIFGRDFPGFGYEESEFAAAVAHELAHNLLSHREWLAEHGRKRKNIRVTEREADRLMPWLLVNAGYDPDAAVQFMKRWGPAHDGGLFRKRTHDGWDERAEFIEGELATIRSVLDEEGRADWSRHFVRDTAG